MKMTEEFKTKQKKIKEWLEAVMAHKLALDTADSEELGLGLCGETKEVHIYKGIEKIAFYLGLTLTYNPNWDPDGRKGYVKAYYNGVEIYQLWDKGRE